MERKPRDLSFLKCSQCRKDRKKCTPLDRPWPGRRCDRCIELDYPCSGNLTAKGQSQRFARALETVNLNENLDEWMGSFAPVPRTISNFPLAAEFSSTKTSYTARSPGESSNDARPTPKSAELFNALKGAGWSYPEQRKSSEREPVGSPEHSVKSGIAIFMKSLTIRFYARVKHRENIIGIHGKYREVVEANIANGFPRRKAERLSIAQLILTLSRLAEDEEDESPTDFVLSIVHMVREGGRWQQLIDAVSAPEILLIGQDHIEGHDAEDHDCHGDKILCAGGLEKQFHKDFTSIDIAKIMRSGDDDVFAKMKELLLMPDLRLKETCQRLSGLWQLINRLGEAEGEFELDDMTSATNKEPAKPGEDANAELISSLASDILRRIREVLRKPDPECQSEIKEMASKLQSFLISEIECQIKKCESEINGKESSSNDNSAEDSCGSNVGGQDQEFDDDFCIHFLNNDAFSSI